MGAAAARRTPCIALPVRGNPLAHVEFACTLNNQGEIPGITRINPSLVVLIDANV